MATSEGFDGKRKILHWYPGNSNLPESLVKVIGDGSYLNITPKGENYTLGWLDQEDQRRTINPSLRLDTASSDDELQAAPATIEIEGGQPIKLMNISVKLLMVVTLRNHFGEGNPGTIIAEAHPVGSEGHDGE